MLLHLGRRLVHFDYPVRGLEEVPVALTAASITHQHPFHPCSILERVLKAHPTNPRSFSLFVWRSARSCLSSCRTAGIGCWNASSQELREAGSMGALVIVVGTWRGTGACGGGWNKLLRLVQGCWRRGRKAGCRCRFDQCLVTLLHTN